MSLQRRYSKAKANGNRVVFDNRTIFPVTFQLAGELPTEVFELGYFRVPGQPMYMTGYRIDFHIPAGDRAFNLTSRLYSGENELVTNSENLMVGSLNHSEKNLHPALAMGAGSTWKLQLTPSGSTTDFYPHDITVTYLLRFANGPVVQTLRAGRFSDEGVGFDIVGTDLVN